MLRGSKVEGAPLEVWRITSARYAERAFDGEGARLYGGRWNQPGTPVVYTSHSLALCALEYFVNLEPELAPKDLVAIQADIPVDVKIASLEIPDLPPDWRVYPAPDSLKDLGTAWARSAETAILSVPSAVIPHERNYLINPVHPAFGRVRLQAAEPFTFDPRMWKH
jgi:RES domain-containing protein